MKIKVLDHEINVIIDEPGIWGCDHMGRAQLSTSTIALDQSMQTDMMQSTFVHELIHIIATINSIEISEQSVDGLALGMFSFIKNNPNWMEKIK